MELEPVKIKSKKEFEIKFIIIYKKNKREKEYFIY
jgi:hypothetical protein